MSGLVETPQAMSAPDPSLPAVLAQLLSHPDAAEAWEKALAMLAARGIAQRSYEKGAAVEAPWLRVAAGVREVWFDARPGAFDATERDELRPLLELGLRRLLDGEALRAVRERMEMLYSASFEGLFFNVDGVVIDVNQRITEMTGYTREEMLGSETLRRIVAPEDQAAVWRRIAERYEGDYVITAVRKDGSRFRAELSAKQGTLGERPVRVAAVRDVTERERTLALLRESEQRLRELTQATFDVTVLSRVGIILDVWGAPEALIGYGRDEIVGRHMFDFVAPPARALAERVLAEDRIGPYETLLLSKEGEMIPVAIVAVMSTLEGESVRLGALRDLRQELRLQAEHRVLEQQMERSQRLESLGVLAGGIAHDFNNLLVGMLGNAELLSERLRDERDRPLAEAIVTAAERAATLTAQMLAYAGRGQLGPRGAVDVGALLHELRTLLAATLSKKAQLELALAPNTVVYGDRATLTQVLMNLLTNASDALEEHAGVISVRVDRVHTPDERFRRALGKPVGPGDWVLIEVRDTGTGMDEATLERVFEPFFTTKSKGHGLGLAACVGIVTSHAGAILVESERGQGSCFSVLLPASQIQAVPVTLPSQGVTRRAHKALIIDDQPMVRAYLRHALTRLGYESEEAYNGESGLARLLREDIDVVVLDMTMPDLSGTEVLTRLRARGNAVPVVLVSGYHDLTGDLDAKAFQAFLVKPFGITQLAKALEEAVARV
jgi:two-component system cell cycle sensor histidine kinase/response regulator CckA